jgi:ectoine hydroxylase-related dioxygenase (phytanoyl-CoA dioxygenase family)
VVDALEQDGFIVVEDALDAAAIRRLTCAVDTVWRGEAPNGEALHRLAFAALDTAFVELVDHPRTLPLVTDKLGWNIYVYHLDVHPPVPLPLPRAWRWHQDGGRQNVELDSPRPRLSVKVAFFLTDVEDESFGPMWLIPKSHLTETLARPADGGIKPKGAQPLLVRAGTAVVFDRRLWHARGENVSHVVRKALFYAYAHRWIQPRDELVVNPALLARLNPVRRQLLGAATSAIGRWIPTDADVPLRARITR